MDVAAHMEVISVSNKRKRLHPGDASILLQSSRDDPHATHCPVSAANSSKNSGSLKMCQDLDKFSGNSVGLVNQSMESYPVSLDLKVRSRNSSDSELAQSSVLVTGADEISLNNYGRFSGKETEELMESSETKRKRVEEMIESSEKKRKKMNFSTSSAAVTNMPSAEEIEEFFSAAEKHEQKRFAEKYNFDIVKDAPLEGRYHWVCLKP